VYVLTHKTRRFAVRFVRESAPRGACPSLPTTNLPVAANFLDCLASVARRQCTEGLLEDGVSSYRAVETGEVLANQTMAPFAPRTHQ